MVEKLEKTAECYKEIPFAISSQYSIFIERAEIKLAINDYREAFCDAERALDLCWEIDNDYPYYNYIIAFQFKIKWAEFDYDWLITEHIERVKAFPDEFIFYLFLADVHMQKEELIIAEKILKVGLIRIKKKDFKADPDLKYYHDEMRHRLAYIYITYRKFERALKDISIPLKEHIELLNVVETSVNIDLIKKILEGILTGSYAERN